MAKLDGVEENNAYYPSLSELIEACGEHFDNLVNRGSYGWRAGHFANDGTLADGSTPEVAVANLWLTLNKK